MAAVSGKQVELKIVYYGPAMSGKTTNVEQVYRMLRPDLRGKLMSMSNLKDDRTIFFDLLPLRVPFGTSYFLSAKLYTVPGQVAYNHSRKIVLQKVDGIVFVADSAPSRTKANAYSFQNMLHNLEELKIDPKSVPVLVQFNKRDLPDVRPMDELAAAWKERGYPVRPAIAVNGEGVLESLQVIMRMAFRGVKKHLPVLGKFGVTERDFVKTVMSNFQPAGERPAAEGPADPGGAGP